MDIIIRKSYLSHIIAHLNRGMMIILIGQRRVGKSFMLRQLNQWLNENRPGSTVVYVNTELIEFSHMRLNFTITYLRNLRLKATIIC